MYYKCKECDEVFIIDDTNNKVYEVLDYCAVEYKTSAEMFLKWHPYLELISKSEKKPKELNNIHKQ